MELNNPPWRRTVRRYEQIIKPVWMESLIIITPPKRTSLRCILCIVGKTAHYRLWFQRTRGTVFNAAFRLLSAIMDVEEITGEILIRATRSRFSHFRQYQRTNFIIPRQIYWIFPVCELRISLPLAIVFVAKRFNISTFICNYSTYFVETSLFYVQQIFSNTQSIQNIINFLKYVKYKLYINCTSVRT